MKAVDFKDDLAVFVAANGPPQERSYQRLGNRVGAYHAALLAYERGGGDRKEAGD